MRISLRVKLALVSLLLLFLPLAGFRFSELIKNDLLESRKETMLFSARAVASALGGRTGLLDQEGFGTLHGSADLYLYTLSSPMRINGKADDWRPQLDEAREFGEENILFSREPYDYNSLHYKHLTGQRGEYLYAIFLVTDDHLVYRNANSLRLDQSDHLQISLEDKKGQLSNYLLSPKEPGWVNGFLMVDDTRSTIPKKREPRIQGMWVESDDGYIIEIRIPREMVGQKMAFGIGDVDDPSGRETKLVIGTATSANGQELGSLLTQSGEIKKILKSLNRPHSQVLIVDTNRRVRASFGSLAEDETVHNDTSWPGAISGLTIRIFSPLYKIFIHPFETDLPTQGEQPSTLDIKGVGEALLGASSVTSYALEGGKVEIMAAVAPLRMQDTIIGAVVVEQTTNSILALQNKVIEESLTLTILVFIFGGLGLLLFASRLSARIRRLSRQASAAISNNGRIRATIKPTSARDEIGDLGRTLISMLGQLKTQTEYREKMADNLEHEMRTPLAGISASLKNMAGELENPSPRITGFLNWALEDVTRMEDLLTTIRDATNLKEALGKDYKEDFSLDTAIEMWLTRGWRVAFAEVDFLYHKPNAAVSFHGDPARIKQMLDKLIENAVSFHTPGTKVELNLSDHQQDSVTITVSNKGPTIPVEMQPQIFNSMVCYRQQKDSEPHLGLGLYIVRTIVEQYQGSVSVASTEDNDGTVFTLTLRK